jgi:hypothetical protein
MYQTDKEIKDDCDALLVESINWAKETFSREIGNTKCKLTPGGKDFTTEDIRAIGTTRFLYLKEKIFNHSPRFYRDKELNNKGSSGTPIIQR